MMPALLLLLVIISSKAVFGNHISRRNEASSCITLFTDVVIDFLGDPSAVTDVELQLLTDELLSVYNVLNYYGPNPESNMDNGTITCDPFQRQITNATIDFEKSRIPENQTRPNLEETTNDVVTYFFSVSHLCCDDRCSDNTNLFDTTDTNLAVDNESRRKMLRSDNRQLQAENADESSSNVCPQDNSFFELRSPTSEEFTTVFSSSIQNAKLKGDLLSIFNVARDVSEVRPVPCDGESVSNSEDKYVNVRGDIVQAINNTDILESAFKIAYQNLVDDDCIFRTINVAKIEGIYSEIGFTNASSADNSGGGYDANDVFLLDFSLYFRITFSCFDCTNLFLQNDASRRREARGRSLQLDNSVCYCDTDSASASRKLSEGAPTTSDFVNEFKAVLQKENETFLDQVISIEDEPPYYSKAPSASPSSNAPSQSLSPTTFTCQQAYEQKYCSKNADCTEVGGTYKCKCKYGFAGDEDGRECRSFNECDSPATNLCPSSESGGFCVDESGESEFKGYKCGCDPKKGVKDGDASTVHGPLTCVDICEENNCDVNADCINNYDGSSYKCSCKEGFDGNGFDCNLPPSSHPSQYPSAAATEEVIVDPADNCLGTDIQTNILSDSSLKGPFNKDSVGPSYLVNIKPEQTRVIFSFDAYAYDSWDSAEGDNIVFKVEGYAKTEIFLMPLGLQSTENGDCTTAEYSWKLTSLSDPAKLYGIEKFADQKHHVTVTLFFSQFDPLGGELTATVGCNLHGKKDESLGVENFRAVSCQTTLPTSPPTFAPTPVPTSEPTPVPTFKPTIPQAPAAF